MRVASNFCGLLVFASDFIRGQSFSTGIMADLSCDANNIFPRYGNVEASKIVPTIEKRIGEAMLMVADLEKKVQDNAYSYETLANDMMKLEEHVAVPWRVASHMKSVMSSDELVEAHKQAQKGVVEFSTAVSQNRVLFKAWKSLRNDAKTWATLNSTRKRVVDLTILSAELQGIGLEKEELERFNKIKLRLADLSSTFNTNTVKATQAFSLRLTTKEQVDGLPPSSLDAMAAAARKRDDPNATAAEGPWLVTLDGTSYMAVMKYSKDRGLREKVYKAYLSRASSIDVSDVDNESVIVETLELRKEKAMILGYKSFADLSMAMKMANLERARGLLHMLQSKAKAVAKREHDELEEFAGKKLDNWDVAFYAEKLKDERYSYDAETVKRYFTLDTVLTGLFKVVHQVFGVEIRERNASELGAELWHKDVKLLEINRQNAPIAYIYFDPYERNGMKKGGAWMAEVAGKSNDVKIPIAHIVTNFQPPATEGAPCLLTFHEITTLFHETGHALQHTLTNVVEGRVSGIRGIEWDAVEQPSQFMEKFAYQKKNMKSMSRHVETGAEIPDELADKLIRSKNYRSASAMMRQLKFALTDLALHDETFLGGDGGMTIWDVDKRIHTDTQVLPQVAEDRFLCGFSHIFGGGYASGYFSYLWAEVLSAENWVAFEEAGLDNDEAVKRVGSKYAETILGMGGSAPAMEIFKVFMNREPSPNALLVQSGITVS